MSDVSKTNELIAKLHNLANLEGFVDDALAELLSDAADALEAAEKEIERIDYHRVHWKDEFEALVAATSVPVQGEHQHEWDPEVTPPRMTCGCDSKAVQQVSESDLAEVIEVAGDDWLAKFDSHIADGRVNLDPGPQPAYIARAVLAALDGAPEPEEKP